MPSEIIACFVREAQLDELDERGALFSKSESDSLSVAFDCEIKTPSGTVLLKANDNIHLQDEAAVQLFRAGHGAYYEVTRDSP